MFKPANKHLLLFLILAFSFVYRMLLMHWTIYPSGADIGLHNSVIRSITLSGNTSFMWNNYQMGGGLSLTFPGYHLFVSYIMLITGMPDCLVHSLVVSFFSSFIVLCAFLITRTVWRESAALIVAFLVAISRFDIEMLLWGGYPNAITLMLIPLAFYLFLQRERFSLAPFIATTTILSATIFLTHSLSALMFVGIIFSTVILVLLFSKKIGLSRAHILIWLLPLFLGALLISPFLIEAAPAYLGANADTFTGGVSDIRLALLSTRVLPLEWVVPLFASVIFFFLFSKKYKGNYFTVSSCLLALWVLVPMVFTQGFLIGLYTDYNRFLYFIILPIIILIGLGIDHGSDFFARIIDTHRSLAKKTPQQLASAINPRSRRFPHLGRKNIYSGFVLVFLMVSFLWVPLFLTPLQGATIQSFYQVMDDPKYEAIQWARQNTPAGSVFVSDAYYGWWLSGFAERPTLSAVDPQYLALAREFEPAQVAKSLLDTNYIIDNGVIQVREDGGYLGRHNPVIIAKLNWTYFPYSFLNFNNSRTEIKYRVGDTPQSLCLDQLPVTEMRIEKDTERATIVVGKGNDSFNYTQFTTVYKGVRFVNMSVTLESVAGVSLDWLSLKVHSKGHVIQLQNKTVGLLDEGVKAFAQLIFDKEQPNVDMDNPTNPCILEIEYNLQGKNVMEIQILVSAYSVTDDLSFYQDPKVTVNYFSNEMNANLNSSQEPIAPISNQPLDIFDYQIAMTQWSISYIVCRYFELVPKFAKDPAFNLVFINGEVAIFMVKRAFN